jgi:hypothetical protein
MPNTTNTPDPMTVAYIALGVAGAIRNLQERDGAVDFEKWEGQFHFVERVVRHAALLDRLAEGRELFGMFLYEVAEPFGCNIAYSLYAESDVSAEDYARKLLDEITAEAAA